MPNMYLKHPAETLGIAVLTPTYAIAAGGSRRPNSRDYFLLFNRATSACNTACVCGWKNASMKSPSRVGWGERSDAQHVPQASRRDVGHRCAHPNLRDSRRRQPKAELSRLFLAFQTRYQRLQHRLRLRVEKRNNEIT